MKHTPSLQRLALTALLVAALSPVGCRRSAGSNDNAASASPTGGTASATAREGVAPEGVAAPPGPASKPASAESAPQVAPSCRALVDLRVLRPGQAGDAEYVVADVRIGEPGAPKIAPGILVRDGDRSFGLTLARHEERARNAFATLEAEWDELVATEVPGGKPASWLDERPLVELPDESLGLPDDVGLDGQLTYQVVGVVGPYVGLSVDNQGYAGGAHGYDDSGYTTVRAGAGHAAMLDVLGAAGRAALEQGIRDAGKGYRDEGGDGDLPELGPKDDGPGLALLPLCEPDNGPCLRGMLYCCTWVENHNLLEVTAPLGELPKALRPFATPEKGSPMLKAPDGCGAVGVKGDALLVRASAKGPVASLPLGRGDASLVGVYWLRPDDPLDVTSLPAPRSYAGSAASLLESARAKVKAGRLRDAVAMLKAADTKSPSDARILAELGYAALLAGEHDTSEQASNKALGLATEDKLRGSILYNLGRLAEAQGKPEAAIGYYERSLGVRPNAKVAERLKALRPAPPETKPSP